MQRRIGYWLLTIGVLSLVSAGLLPLLAHFSDVARNQVSTERLLVLGQAVRRYAETNHGQLPTLDFPALTRTELTPYLDRKSDGSKAILGEFGIRCQANTTLSRQAIYSVRNPEEVILLYGPTEMSWGNAGYQVFFLDGHWHFLERNQWNIALRKSGMKPDLEPAYVMDDGRVTITTTLLYVGIELLIIAILFGGAVWSLRKKA